MNTIDEFQAILNGGDTAALTVDLSREVSARVYDEICRKERVRLIGDIAFYYLNYVEEIAAHNDNVRFICLKRERAATVESWIGKVTIPRWRSKRFADRLASLITREPYYHSSNPWMVHDGTKWQIDQVWDKCFPKFEASTMRDAIGQYWDMYYSKAEQLRERLPGVFRIVRTSCLDQPAAQRELLSFCGIPADVQVRVDAHIHRSKAST